ncbi:MAG: hypothetical protein QNJ31_02110 [Candidatus Caenarcaniphilales bacterium]|nr:hypothetical protein [Candidatus Caenarcaniphilales bacterium]
MAVTKITKPAVMRRNDIKPFSRQKAKKDLPWYRSHEAIWLTLTKPGKGGANISKLTWITTLLPLLAAPILMAGLTARSFSDVSLKNNQQPNGFVKLLRNIYPAAYSLMMVCGILNGVGYASISRILSYSLLLLGAGFVWNQENKRNSSLEELAKLGIDPNSPDVPKNVQDLKDKLADATASISAFARIYYCFAMFFTFLANTTQVSPKVMIKGKLTDFSCKVSDSSNIRDILSHFGKNWRANFQKEIAAGAYYGKSIFSLKQWKHIGKTLVGKNKEFEATIPDTQNPILRFLYRLGEPNCSGTFTMLNGLTRFFSVIGTALAVSQLGIQVFNDEDPLLKSQKVAQLEKEKPAMKTLFDVTMNINNLGNAFMGLCSYSTGFNQAYSEKLGMLSAILQRIGATMHMLSVACDTQGWYLLGQAFKLFSNACFQLANAFGTAFKAVPNLIRNNLLTV